MSAVSIKNIYYMLTYAYDVLKSKEYERLGRENFENIYDLLATLLLCGTNDLIRRGFIKSYISQTDELTTIRGRINISQSIRRLSFQNAKTICDFDEFSADIYFNQIIKATLLYLKRCPVKVNIKRDISKVLQYFNEIGTITISAIKWENLIFNRNNAHYDTLIYFCKLICEEAIANKEKGSNNFRVIEDKLLPKLFEKFIFAFYKSELPDCSVLYQKKINWKTDNFEMLPTMNVDTIIVSGSNKLIIDTKFYSKTSQIHPFSNNRTVISSNLYQIFTYVKNEAANFPENNVGGMLLYPQVDEEIKNAPYNMSGNNVFVRTVDLNQEFTIIRQELMEIYISTGCDNVL